MQRLRALTAALLLSALTLASALSAAPLCHEWLHDVTDSASHQCAATLLSSGAVELSACDAAAVAPPAAPLVRASSPDRSLRIVAHLEFTRLEHAPPSFS